MSGMIDMDIMEQVDDSEPVNPRPHIVYEKENEEGKYGDSHGYIPFLRMDADR